jgi:hypothetical protein
MGLTDANLYQESMGCALKALFLTLCLALPVVSLFLVKIHQVFPNS